MERQLFHFLSENAMLIERMDNKDVFLQYSLNKFKRTKPINFYDLKEENRKLMSFERLDSFSFSSAMAISSFDSLFI